MPSDLARSHRSPPPLVVFDLDGTLVDTGPDLAAALNHVLVGMGRPAIDVETVRDLVGMGAAKLIERGLTVTGGSSEALIDEGLPRFLAFYGDNICNASVPYTGIEAAMDALAGEGVTLAICTNKPEALSRKLVDALGWTGRFAANLGGDSLPVRKPNPRHLLETIAAAGGSVAGAAYVGDTIIDVQAARAAGVPVIAVSFGFADGDPMALGADLVIDHYDELLPALAALPAAATA